MDNTIPKTKIKKEDEDKAILDKINNKIDLIIKINKTSRK